MMRKRTVETVSLVKSNLHDVSCKPRLAAIRDLEEDFAFKKLCFSDLDTGSFENFYSFFKKKRDEQKLLDQDKQKFLDGVNVISFDNVTFSVEVTSTVLAVMEDLLKFLAKKSKNQNNDDGIKIKFERCTDPESILQGLTNLIEQIKKEVNVNFFCENNNPIQKLQVSRPLPFPAAVQQVLPSAPPLIEIEKSIPSSVSVLRNDAHDSASSKSRNMEDNQNELPAKIPVISLKNHENDDKKSVLNQKVNFEVEVTEELQSKPNAYDLLLNFEKSIKDKFGKKPENDFWKKILAGDASDLDRIGSRELASERDAEGNSAWHIASLSNSNELHQVLFGKGGAYGYAEVVNHNHLHPLHIAAVVQNLNFIECFIKKIESNTRLPCLTVQVDNYNFEAQYWHLSLLGGGTDIFEKIVLPRLNDSLFLISNEIGNIFHLLVLKKLSESIKTIYYLLLQKKQKTEIEDLFFSFNSSHRTPFGLAFERGYNDVMQVFLDIFPSPHLQEKLVNTYCPDDHPFTPLYFAVQADQFDAIEFLNKKNISLDIEKRCGFNRNKKTPYDIANSMKDPSISNFFQQYQISERTERSPNRRIINAIVLECGDMTNISYLSALHALQRMPDFFDRLSGVLGYSLQSLSSVFMALGVSSGELYRTFLEDIYPRLWTEKNSNLFRALKNLNKDDFDHKIFGYLSYIEKRASYDYLSDSLLNLDGLSDWLRREIDARTGRSFTTFGDLKELCENDSTYKNLYVPVRRISDGKVLFINSVSNDYLNVVISDAIIAACSIPLVYGSHALAQRMEFLHGEYYRHFEEEYIAVNYDSSVPFLGEKLYLKFDFLQEDQFFRIVAASPTAMSQYIIKKYEHFSPAAYKDNEDRIFYGDAEGSKATLSAKDLCDKAFEAVSNSSLGRVQGIAFPAQNVLLDKVLYDISTLEVSNQQNGSVSIEHIVEHLEGLSKRYLEAGVSESPRILVEVHCWISDISKQIRRPMADQEASSLSAIFKKVITSLSQKMTLEDLNQYIQNYFIDATHYLSRDIFCDFYMALSGLFLGKLDHALSAYYAHYASLYTDGFDNNTIEKITIIERSFVLNFALKNPDRYESRWEIFYDQLKRIRQENVSEMTIFNSKIREFIKGVASWAAETTETHYQSFPRNFCLVGLGSIASGFFSVYSDLDVALLIEDESEEAGNPVLDYPFFYKKDELVQNITRPSYCIVSKVAEKKAGRITFKVKVSHCPGWEEEFDLDYLGELSREALGRCQRDFGYYQLSAEFREFKQFVATKINKPDYRYHPAYQIFLKLLTFIFSSIGETLKVDNQNKVRAGLCLDGGDIIFLSPRRHRFYLFSSRNPASDLRNPEYQEGVYCFFESNSSIYALIKEKGKVVFEKRLIPSDSGVPSLQELGNLRRIEGSCRPIVLDQRAVVYVLSQFEEYKYGMMFHRPLDMANRWSPKKQMIDREYHAVYHTLSLYQHDTNKDDLNLAYQQLLSNEWDKRTDEIKTSQHYARKSFDHHQASDRQLSSIIQKKQEDVDIKQGLCRPLTLWITDVSLLLGQYNSDYSAFFSILTRHGCNQALVNDIELCLEKTWAWRVKYSLEGKVFLDGNGMMESRESIKFSDFSENDLTDLLYYAQSLIYPLIHSLAYFRDHPAVDFGRFNLCLLEIQDAYVKKITGEESCGNELKIRLLANYEKSKIRYNPSNIRVPNNYAEPTRNVQLYQRGSCPASSVQNEEKIETNQEVDIELGPTACCALS